LKVLLAEAVALDLGKVGCDMQQGRLPLIFFSSSSLAAINFLSFTFTSGLERVAILLFLLHGSTQFASS
jgi:hypothetical protein